MKQCVRCNAFSPHTRSWYVVYKTGAVRKTDLCNPCWKEKARFIDSLRRFETYDEALIYKVTRALE